MNTTRSDRRFTHYARLGVEAMADELRRTPEDQRGDIDAIAARALKRLMRERAHKLGKRHVSHMDAIRSAHATLDKIGGDGTK